MLLTDLSMRSTLPQHMIGGKALSTAFYQFLLILAPGHGNNGVAGEKFTAFKNMSNLNMTTLASAHADLEPSIKG